MNAVAWFAASLAPEAVRRVAASRASRFAAVAASPGEAGSGRQLAIEEARMHVAERWAEDLCGLLNALTHDELAQLASRTGVAPVGRSPDLRAALWDRGAALERAGATIVPSLQPRPVVLGGHLVVLAPPRGSFPPSARWPRPIPERTAPDPPADEPETLDDLLAAADRAIGVPLGPRGRDKGAWGNRAAALLGVVECGRGEPDWRGDVELKTVAVARDRSGLWRIVEDPAIAMVTEGTALAKLQRTLWLARCDVGDDATILSWYLLDWDAYVARLVRRYLHTRPKGPAGTTQHAWYLHKRFFADAGLLASLNGVT